MAQDSTQVRIAPNGRLLVAPAGTVAPADVSAVWGTAWQDLGYADETGVTITPTLTTAEVKAWQTASPLAIIPTEVKYEVKFVLQQFNQATTGLFFGGAAWTETVAGSGVWKLTVPSSPNLDLRMLGIEWSDGTNTNRLVIKRGMVSARDALAITRTGNQKFGTTWTALDSAGDLFDVLSNDAALAAV